MNRPCRERLRTLVVRWCARSNIPSRSVAAGAVSKLRIQAAEKTQVVASLWVGTGESCVSETSMRQFGGGGDACDAAKERKIGA